MPVVAATILNWGWRRGNHNEIKNLPEYAGAALVIFSGLHRDTGSPPNSGAALVVRAVPGLV